MGWVIATSLLIAAAFLGVVAWNLPYWQDRTDVILRRGWVIEKTPTPGFYGNNHDHLKTMKGWESISTFKLEVERGKYRTYIYANGWVYYLHPDAEPMVRQIIERLLEQSELQAA